MAFSNLSFHLSASSGNAKTGKMAVSTSSKITCSPSCPFLPQNGGGCYAQGGPLNLHWLKVTSGERGTSFEAFLENLRRLPDNAQFRHNQAGDLVHEDGQISAEFIYKMTDAVKHLRAYTYTHHDITKGDNLALLRHANKHGFKVNISCETEQQVDSTIAADLPAVVVVDSEEERTQWRTKDGNTVLVCPAQRKDITCAECMLCHRRGKKVAIAFLAHGNGKRKVNSILSQKVS